MLICRLYTKNNSYSIYKFIFNSSKPWVGGSNPSWITKEIKRIARNELSAFVLYKFIKRMTNKVNLSLFFIDRNVKLYNKFDLVKLCHVLIIVLHSSRLAKERF